MHGKHRDKTLSWAVSTEEKQHCVAAAESRSFSCYLLDIDRTKEMENFQCCKVSRFKVLELTSIAPSL